MKISFLIQKTGTIQHESKVFYLKDESSILTISHIWGHGISLMIEMLGINLDHEGYLGDISGYCPKGRREIGKVDFPESYVYGKLLIPEDIQKNIDDGSAFDFDGIEHVFIYDESTHILRIGNIVNECTHIMCMPDTIASVDEFGYVKTLRIHITEIDSYQSI